MPTMGCAAALNRVAGCVRPIAFDSFAAAARQIVGKPDSYASGRSRESVQFPAFGRGRGSVQFRAFGRGGGSVQFRASGRSRESVLSRF